ncbi:hypothetical protein KP509_34G047600 [Ceratopteris richardii]|nr:hypothetical protein KP509_34G047600 [Ceratopteris richardii]
MPPELMLFDDWPIYSIAGLPDFCSDTVINRQDASDWSILHLVNVQGTVKMSVLALPGDVGQLSESMAAGMRRACSLLSLRVAEWILCNASRSAPSVSELNEIMFAAERYVQEHRLFLRQEPLPDLLAIARAHAPGIVIPSVYTLSLEQVDALAGAGETVIVHRDGGDGVAAIQLKEVGGSFEHMWTKFIAVPGKVFIAHYIDHFFVLRVDEQYEFWIVDTQGSPSGEGLDRACVLSFGPSTIFSTHELPIATTFYHDMTSADACKLFFRHFVANDCGIRELMKHPQCQPPPSLARQIAFFEVARVGEGDALSPS